MLEIIVILAALAAGYVIFRARGGRAAAQCRWRRDPTHKTGAAQRYICRRCGVDAFTRDGRAPQICHRAARSAS